MTEFEMNGDTNKKDEDLIQSTIGNFGRWQMKISILMALLKFPIAWFQLSIIFLAPPTQFWCRPPDLTNTTTDSWLETLHNNSPLKQEGLNTGFCHGVNTTAPCTNTFAYNRTVYHSSIITEWDLVCENKRLIDISQISLMFGVLIGNIFFGVFADRSGRKKSLIICIFLQAIIGIAAAYIPWFWGFILARFLLAVANGGTMVISFVMCMEVVGGIWRTIIPILYQIPYGFGNSIMAGLAYVYRDWRDLQLAISFLSLFYILYLWLVPESPRWLMVTGKKDEAVKILLKAAKTNKLDANKVQIVVAGIASNQNKHHKVSLSAIFSTVELRRRSLLLCFNWFLAGVTFYAFSQYAGKVASNLYFTAAISGFVAFPGTLLCVFVTQHYGRRWTIAGAHLLTAICFFGILFVPIGVYPEDWPRVAIAGVGIVGLSVSLPALYLFTGELFPTTIRNVGVGASVMFSRIGSMVAPLVIAMQDVSQSLPLLILGAGAVIETALILFLPETKGVALPETITDLQQEKFKDNTENMANESYVSLSKDAVENNL